MAIRDGDGNTIDVYGNYQGIWITVEQDRDTPREQVTTTVLSKEKTKKLIKLLKRQMRLAKL